MVNKSGGSTKSYSRFRFIKTKGRAEVEQIGKVVLLLGVVFIAVSIYWSTTSFNTLQKPMQEVLTSDEAFKGMQVEVKYAKFMKKDTVLFNLKKVSMKTQLLAPFKLLLSYLVKMEDNGRSFSLMEIQYKGKTRFVVNGETVSALVARTYSEKPIDIALDFPALVETPGGKKPYVQPYGDEQYVAQKKYHNFEQLMDTWFLNEMRKQGTSGEKPEKTEADAGKKKPGKKSESPADIPEIPNVIDDEPGQPPEKAPVTPPKKPVVKPTAEEKPIDEETPPDETPGPGSSPKDEVPAIEPEEI